MQVLHYVTIDLKKSSYPLLFCPSSLLWSNETNVKTERETSSLTVAMAASTALSRPVCRDMEGSYDCNPLQSTSYLVSWQESPPPPLPAVSWLESVRQSVDVLSKLWSVTTVYAQGLFLQQQDSSSQEHVVTHVIWLVHVYFIYFSVICIVWNCH